MCHNCMCSPPLSLTQGLTQGLCGWLPACLQRGLKSPLFAIHIDRKALIREDPCEGGGALGPFHLWKMGEPRLFHRPLNDGA